MKDIPEGYKRCGRGENCIHPDGPVLPATTAYFWRDRSRRDGFQGLCIACRSANKKRFRRENPERVREIDRRNHERHREKRIQQAKEWRERNIEHVREHGRRYKREHRERYRQQKRERRRRDPEKVRQEYRRWYENNPDYHRRWRTKNPHRAKQIKIRRRARERQLPATFSKEDWKCALRYFGNRCAVCGNPPDLWHRLAADHWTPLNSPDCPGSVATNIVPLCHSRKGGKDGCNNIKNDRLPEDWLIETYGKKEAVKILARIEEYFEWVRVQKKRPT